VARPLIGITTDLGLQSRKDVPYPAWVLKQAYVRAVAEAGGQAVVIGPDGSPDAGVRAAALCDGIVVTGGDFDLPSTLSGASPAGRIDPPKPERTRFEAQVVEACRGRSTPILGICGGMQLLGVLAGATVVGDISTELPNALPHEQPDSPSGPSHPVRLEGWMAELCGDEVHVNSTHHQSLKGDGRGRVLGRAPDGVIEAIDVPEWNAFGVQWHPELLDDVTSARLYRTFVQRCASRPDR
jgi:putative glutamine amidotransferase